MRFTSASSSSVSRHPAAAAFDRACSGFVAPAMTETTVGRARSHENASSRIVRPRYSAKGISFSTIPRFTSESRGKKRGSPKRVPLGGA